jgi:tRNA threonylcarbamoyladenosine biosynthesis protein TsaE
LSTPIALRGSLDQNQQNTGQIWWSQSQDETSALANRLMLNHLNQLHKTGLIFALNGPLGIGKTIFAKGVAKFLGIQTIINSPS